ncbi:hypothetical protein [Halopelagius longus]|uniref:Uncharacterized protein n=1 Tax=Halopelagius longus TaxID=1236180 RepID=A0A1H1C362_9EURY|nr:hypothetical protein [Halopelagius longus]RDI71048.1 hypothetical protein DWB78_04495 [Halopelagius longus]SDQ58663.1 hypothetical protein SAMN05216278_2090 [Halopelagius longus]
MTYRAVTRNRDVVCDRYELGEHGVELYAVDEHPSSARRTASDGEETFLAFVPYENLLSILNEDAARAPDPSIL